MNNITISKLDWVDYADNLINKKRLPLTLNQWLEQEFLTLATHLNDLLGEEERFKEVKNFVMPAKVLKETATFLKDDWMVDWFTKTNGGYYYAGMLADYSGLLEAQYIKRMTKKQKEENFI